MLSKRIINIRSSNDDLCSDFDAPYDFYNFNLVNEFQSDVMSVSIQSEGIPEGPIYWPGSDFPGILGPNTGSTQLTEIPPTPIPIPTPTPVKASLEYRNGGRQFGKGIIKNMKTQIEKEGSKIHFLVEREIKLECSASLKPYEKKQVLKRIKDILKNYDGKNKLQSLIHFRKFWGVDQDNTKRLEKIAYSCIRKFSRFWLKTQALDYLEKSQCDPKNLKEMKKIIPKFINGSKHPVNFVKLC